MVFDPPHLVRAGKKGWQAKKYGKLEGDWKEMLRLGFAECFRVLRPEGTLIFKWNEHDVPVSQILALTPEHPLVGQRCGKTAKTHWLVFMKSNDQAQSPNHRNLDSILDQLTSIAGELEDACAAIQAARSTGHAAVLLDAITEDRIRRSLKRNLTKGNEAVAVVEAIDLVAASLAVDGGPPVTERVIRAVLPKLMHELFDVRISCSIRHEGRYARGWRGLAPK
ncbi:MAG TPA: hypothetical protein VLD18_01560 [Verrucomicrobiae bacterium]|nr:hypothetical protein [Verrucomicrobiae bacterium]